MAERSYEILADKTLINFLGPYMVLKKYKNDVKCKNLVMQNVCTFVVTRLKTFYSLKLIAMKLPRSTLIRLSSLPSRTGGVYLIQ